MGTCIGFLFDLFGLPASGERPWKGFLLTCLGAGLVYPLAAWQGYLGTSVGFLFDLFGLPASGERPWKGFLLTCLSQCAGCPWAGLDFWFLFELFGCQGCLGGGFAKGRDSDRAVWVPV